jgi:hypothetical protein
VYALWQSRRYETPLWALLLPVLGGLALLLPELWLRLNRPESLLHTWLTSWSVRNAISRHFSHVDGEYVYMLPVGLYYLQPLAHPNYMLPTLSMAALWGGRYLWRKGAWGPLILLGGWAGVVYLFLAGIPYQNFRFALTGYVPLAALAGVGIEALRVEPPGWWARNHWGTIKHWGQSVTAVALASLLVMMLWALRSSDRFLSAQNASKETARAVAAALPGAATLLAFDLTLTLEHYTDLQVVEFYNLDQPELEQLTSGAAPVYLLLDVENVAQQWRDRPPQVNYRWLQQERTLTPLAEFPPYSLFEVSSR